MSTYRPSVESPIPRDTYVFAISGADILQTVLRGNDVTSNASSIWKMSSFIQLEAKTLTRRGTFQYLCNEVRNRRGVTSDVVSAYDCLENNPERVGIKSLCTPRGTRTRVPLGDTICLMNVSIPRDGALDRRAVC